MWNYILQLVQKNKTQVIFFSIVLFSYFAWIIFILFYYYQTDDLPRISQDNVSILISITLISILVLFLCSIIPIHGFFRFMIWIGYSIITTYVILIISKPHDWGGLGLMIIGALYGFVGAIILLLFSLIGLYKGIISVFRKNIVRISIILISITIVLGTLGIPISNYFIRANYENKMNQGEKQILLKNAFEEATTWKRGLNLQQALERCNSVAKKSSLINTYSYDNCLRYNILGYMERRNNIPDCINSYYEVKNNVLLKETMSQEKFALMSQEYGAKLYQCARRNGKVCNWKFIENRKLLSESEIDSNMKNLKCTDL